MDPTPAASAAAPGAADTPGAGLPLEGPATSPRKLSGRRSGKRAKDGRDAALFSRSGLPSEDELEPTARQPVFGVSLFWRTFVLLAVLMFGGIFAWVQTLSYLEFEPRAVQGAQQIASLVNISRAAFRYTDSINRTIVVKTMSDQEALRMLPREPTDRHLPFAVDRFTERVAAELRSKLGGDTIVARSVNGEEGLWVGFSIDKENLWLRVEPTRLQQLAGRTWLLWVGIALVATLLASLGMATLLNQPLKQLSFAASRIRGGEFDSHLDENTMTREIRDVNRGFNRMARALGQMEQDRTVMLAGISHDLRTPLARLRLETEMSVIDEDAKRNMASDIDQLDAIIAKFMDYARPGDPVLESVVLATLVEREAANFRDPVHIRIAVRIDPAIRVIGDETELARVFANLFENAKRYGRTPETGVARVEVNAHQHNGRAVVIVRDWGPGVAQEKIEQLTSPFFRGDAARTAANGAGLGLAIVKKSLQRMGGEVTMSNGNDGGLMARIHLKCA